MQMPKIKTVKMPIGRVIQRRILRELVLVKILRLVDKDGKDIPKEWVLKELELCIKAERNYIKNNPKKAISIYACFYNGDRKTAKDVIENILIFDYVDHYSKILKGA